MFRKTHVALILALLAAGVVQAEPRLEVTETTFNYGKVVQEASIRHGFWLKSVGDDTVHIVNIFPGCGCTQIPVTDSSLAPGDSLKLDILLNTERFVGFVSKQPTITINRDSNAVVRFNIYAEMITQPENDSPFVLSPPMVDVSQFTVKLRRKATFNIQNKTGETFTVTPIDTSAENISVELPTRIGPHATAEGRIVVDKDATEKSFTTSITFEAVGSTQRATYTIPILRLYRPKDAGTQ